MATQVIRMLVPGLLLLLLGRTSQLAAQNRPAQFEFRHIQEKDGLGFNFINCFLQDHDGFLWIGTNDGLNRYDGNQFVQFKQKRQDSHSLLNNTVHDVCEDQRGKIWLAVDNGISRYEKETGRFTNLTTVQGRPLGFCNNILCDRRGNVWFTSAGVGLYRYDQRTGRIQYFPYRKTDTPQTAISLIPKNGLLEDPFRNGLWIADQNGLHYFDSDGQAFINHENNPEQLPLFTNHSVSALALDRDRLIFADNQAQKIVVFSLTRRQILQTFTPVSSQTKRNVFGIATIFVDRQGDIWTSSRNYLLFHIATKTSHITELQHDEARPTSIAGDFFGAGWQHPDGSIWLGTVNGISITNPERSFYNVYNLGALFPALNDERGILCSVEDADGSWWLGTSIRGLLHYFPQTNRLEVYKLPNATAERPYGMVISSLAPAGDTLYVAGETGLFTFHKKRKAFSSLPLPMSFQQHKNRLWNILKDGEYLWASGESTRAFRYHIPTRQWQSYPVWSAGGKRPFILSFYFKDRVGDTWVYLYPGGIARFSPQREAFVVDSYTQNKPYDYSVTSITKDSAGDFWMSTNGYGLLRYNARTHRYASWTESEGLAYDHCLAALPDRWGNIWVSSYNKFSVFSPRSNRFLNFSLPYNPANSEYSSQLLPLRNGHILSTLKGYAVEFFPEKLPYQSAYLPDKILISQVTIGTATWLNHGGLASVDLKAGETNFTVHFGAITSALPTPFDYFYQLDGYEDWKPAGGASHAVYTGMPSGNYTFRVKAVARDGRQTAVSALPVRIDTFFYNTRWFRALLLLGLLSIGLVLLRYRVKQTARLHHLQVQASRLERDKTEIQYQNLINHLNPHFLFNSLTSLGSLIVIDPRQASNFLQKLATIYRYILQNKEKDTVSLAGELAFVQHYVELQQAQFEAGLQIRMEVPPAYLAHEIVPVTLQNLFENAIKHNTTEEDSPLRIRVYVADEYLCVANNLQRKPVVKTSNKQGLDSLKKLYTYLSDRPLLIEETATEFLVKIPLL